METLQREVSATLAEFLRGFGAAFPDHVPVGPGCYIAHHGAAVMEIQLSPAAPRRIASLLLPTLQVTIRFTAGTKAEREGMLAHMDRTMHRGGG
ncbi:hypothetical protein EG831_00330 [bacterium]|nr:hypothetical protein [bacterium]